MSNEEKQEQQVVEQKKEVTRGPRGEVGKGSTSKTIKLRWHEAHFTREDKSDNAHPHRKSWVRVKGVIPSLKEFADKLAKDGDQVAKDWLAHKAGSLDLKRSEKNTARIAVEASATKAAKHKKKGQN